MIIFSRSMNTFKVMQVAVQKFGCSRNYEALHVFVNKITCLYLYHCTPTVRGIIFVLKPKIDQDAVYLDNEMSQFRFLCKYMTYSFVSYNSSMF